MQVAACFMRSSDVGCMLFVWGGSSLWGACCLLNFCIHTIIHSYCMQHPHSSLLHNLHTCVCVLSCSGDTMNTASRMESTSRPGRIQISEKTYQLLRDPDASRWEATGGVEVNGKGRMYTFLLAQHLCVLQKEGGTDGSQLSNPLGQSPPCSSNVATSRLNSLGMPPCALKGVKSRPQSRESRLWSNPPAMLCPAHVCSNMPSNRWDGSWIPKFQWILVVMQCWIQGLVQSSWVKARQETSPLQLLCMPVPPQV